MKDIYNWDYIVDLLREEGLVEYKVYHSMLVAKIALAIADEVKKDEYPVDERIVKAGALLHDIGISRTENDFTPNHGAIGGKIARKHGYPEAVARAIEAHENVATKEEAIKTGVEMDRENFLPESWEDKIVFFADHSVVVVAECCREKEYWDEPKCTVKATFPYWKKVFKKYSNEDIDSSHPIFQREHAMYQLMIKYVKPEFFNESRDLITKMQEEQIKYGLTIPFEYAEELY